MEVTHDWAFTYINIALGNEVEKFNQTLVPVFNQTGDGTFCLPSAGGDVLAELGVTEGMNATLQVIQLSTTGNALYNVSHMNFFEEEEKEEEKGVFSWKQKGSIH